MSYAAREIKRLMGKAIHQCHMIEEGDKILVAVSGGQDSLSLLWLLRDRLRRVPISYDLMAVHVELGFSDDTREKLEHFLRTNGFVFSVLETKFGPLAHGTENRENPCFLCSRLRRKAIFEKAAELECNKVAFGHHKDDFIETFFLNLFFAGSISTLRPCQELFNGKLIIVRPLYLVNTSTIKKFAEEMGFPALESGCPSSLSSKRRQIRSLLFNLYKSNRKIKANITSALQGIEGFDNWR